MTLSSQGKALFKLRKEFLDDTYFVYSVRPFAPIPQHYFSKYWGDQCMGRPHLKFGGTVPQSTPRSPPLQVRHNLGQTQYWWDTVAETWRRVWGDGKFFRTPRFLFGKKFHFHAQNFLLNVVYDPFFTRKNNYFRKEFLDDTFFYSFRTFARIRQHYTSQNIGGTDAWAVPPPQIFGGTVPPVSPRFPPLGRHNIGQIWEKQYGPNTTWTKQMVWLWRAKKMMWLVKSISEDTTCRWSYCGRQGGWGHHVAGIQTRFTDWQRHCQQESTSLKTIGINNTRQD